MKQLETDVVVIAAGTAGLAAALTAAENGARVVVFEKASTTGGTSNMALGIFAVESRLQRQKQMSVTKEEAFRVFMDYTHWRVDARLVKAYIDMSAGTLDWLERMGIEFAEPDAYFAGSYFTQHTLKVHGGGPGAAAPGGQSLPKVLTDKAKARGVQFFLRTPARKILKSGGRVAGVQAEDESGEAIQAKARAVIVATGGFGDNPEMIKKYTGFEYGRDLFPVAARNMVGDGIRMAWEAGAGQEGLNMQLIYLVPETETYREVGIAFHQPHLVVNILGERFINEEILGNTTFTGNAIARQKDRCAFNIFDEDTKEYFEKNTLDFPKGIMSTPHIDAEFKQAIAQGHKFVFVADSLEELAAKTGINPEGLRRTVEEYNRAGETGRDTLLDKKAKYLRPVRRPRFYAGKLYPTAYGSLGGIKINYKTEVLTNDHEVIPGLYAAGVDANAIYGDSYVIVLPGNTMGFAVNSGRMAGAHAARYALGG